MFKIYFKPPYEIYCGDMKLAHFLERDLIRENTKKLVFTGPCTDIVDGIYRISIYINKFGKCMGTILLLMNGGGYALMDSFMLMS